MSETRHFVSSYDENAPLPRLGTRWVWELEKPHARALIEVVAVFWNGEEWWVRTSTLLPLDGWDNSKTLVNDLSRFWEAVTAVGGWQRGHMVERRAAVSVGGGEEEK
jgi:hypothetical protein